jgi:hypothetical protein
MPAAVSALNSVLFPTFGNPTMPASMIKFSLANGNSQTQEYNQKGVGHTKSRQYDETSDS